MQFGILLNINGHEGRPDSAVISEHVALGELADALGLDSLFVLEHHFSDYILSPSPFQLLSYFAGRSSGLQLGTAVVVLPWHNPIRVAEEIAVLDTLSGGRASFGFGKGRAAGEFAGFGVPQYEAAERFVEAVEIVVGALRDPEVRYDGKHYSVPKLTVRPHAHYRPESRLYGAVSSRASAELVGGLGLGAIAATDKCWTEVGADLAHHGAVARARSHDVPTSIVVSSISVSESREEATEVALQYLARDAELASKHYEEQTRRLQSSSERNQAQEQRRDNSSSPGVDQLRNQVVGNPADCIDQIRELRHLTETDHLLLEFSYGAMPVSIARENLSVFAAHVLPVARELCA